MQEKIIWSRLFFAAIFSMTVLSFQATAFSPTRISYFSAEGLRLSGTKLAEAGIQRIETKRSAAGVLIHQLMDSKGNVIRNFIIGKTAPKYLKEFAPSKVRDAIKYFGTNAGKISLAKLKHFPMEAFSFFVAIGALTAYDVVFNFSQNPVASDQFVQSQQDPVGQMGFAAFMVAAGNVSEPLMAVAESRGARFFIPYLGMTVGMAASHIVGEIAHFPGLGKCVKSLITAAKSPSEEAKSDAACDEAFDAWTELKFSEKGHEFAPTLFSMLSSAVAIAVAKLALVPKKKTIAAGILASTAKFPTVAVSVIEFAVGLTPAGRGIHFGSWIFRQITKGLGRVANPMAFLAVDGVFNGPFTFAYKNAVQLGPELAGTDNRLGLLLANKFVKNFNEETSKNATGLYPCNQKGEKNCYQDLDFELQDFQNLMEQWRMTNLMSVMTSFHNWSAYLNELASQYRYAKSFYENFVMRMWTRNYDSAPGYLHLVDRSMPLFGITPKGESDATKLMQEPNATIKKQLKTVADTVAWIEKQESSNPAYQASKNLLPRHLLKDFQNFVAGLSSNDPQKIGEAILQMKMKFAKNKSPLQIESSDLLVTLLRPIYQLLGAPDPQMEPGKGFLKLMAEDSKLGFQDNPFEMTSAKRRIPFSNGPEYLVYQMVFGPDPSVGQKSIQVNYKGFPSQFLPPQIRMAGEVTYEIPAPVHGVRDTSAGSIFYLKNFPIDGVSGGSIIDYLRSSIRPEVVGSAHNKKGNEIKKWWDQNMDQELTEAMLFYEETYEDIIQELYLKLFAPESFKTFFQLDGSVTNRGPFANGVLESLEQERRIYLYILDSLFRTKNNLKWVPPQRSIRENSTDKTKGYSILESSKEIPSSKTSWVVAINKEWEKTRSLLGRLENKIVRTKRGQKKFVVSRITNKELSEQIKRLDDLVEQIPSIEGMTEFQKNIAATAMTGLVQSQHQILDYAKVINNVSYLENFQGKILNEPQKQACITGIELTGFGPWLQGQKSSCPDEKLKN